jgi:hypothetical protein
MILFYEIGQLCHRRFALLKLIENLVLVIHEQDLRAMGLQSLLKSIARADHEQL